MTTTGVAHRQHKLKRGLILSKGLAFCWYYTRIQARGYLVDRKEIVARAKVLAVRYRRMVENVV